MRKKSNLHNESTLVISNLPSYTGKVERHLEPLSTIQDNVKIVCLTNNVEESFKNIDIKSVPIFKMKLVKILLLFFVSIYELYSSEYDRIVSVSLFPYGVYGLILGNLFNKPTHLRIIGADIPVHSRAWYRSLPLSLFPYFDSISVHSMNHKIFLEQNGVTSEKIYIVPGSIDSEKYNSRCDIDIAYDLIWTGKMEDRKRPLLFVETVRLLRDSGYEFNAVMLGSGVLEKDIQNKIKEYGLTNIIDQPGWVEEPVSYYHKSKIFILTSKREAFGFPLVEAMACGLVCIAPKYADLADGSTDCIINDGENGHLVQDINPKKLSKQIEHKLNNNGEKEMLKRAQEVRQKYSQEKMSQRWEDVLVESL